MRFVFFVHSLLSDWNHGNAHFLRGVMRELIALGHEAVAFEPEDGWSRRNLLAEARDAEEEFRRDFPTLRTTLYRRDGFDADAALDGADVAVVHEWNEPWLVAEIGRRRRGGGRFLLLFHDTHHRAVSDRDGIARFDLDGFDGVLAFGEVVRDIYLKRGWGRRAWTWHEAADTALFRPPADGRPEPEADLVWVGNWGDDERTDELQAFLLGPVRDLGLSATVHGVRYPPEALDAVRAAGARFAGRLPNARVPAAFARHRMTVHVPRRPYARTLPGIPTIRVFEALACGIPLVTAPWDDAEGLFRPGEDFLVAPNGDAMRRAMRAVLNDGALAQALAASGLARVRARHTCAHRVRELLAVCAACRGDTAAPAADEAAS